MIIDRAKIIRDATLKARKSFEAYNTTQMRAIFDLFDDAADRLSERLNGFVREGKIIPARMAALQKAVQEEMIRLRPDLKNTIIKGMRENVSLGMETGMYSMQLVKQDKNYKYAVGNSFIGKDGKIHRYNPANELYRDSAWARINGAAMDSLLRYNPIEITLSERVWHISMTAERAIRSQLGTSILLGESPAVMSRQIREFLRGLKPNEPHWYRKYGAQLTVRSMGFEPPGRGVYRSAAANAMRLARTEYARAYSEGTRRYAQSKDWIKGYISRTTSGNPAPYDASIDGQYFEKGSEPSPPYHPNCMCYLELVYDETIPPKEEWATSDQLKGPEHWNKKQKEAS